MTLAKERPPSKEQLTRIRELSEIVLGHPERLFGEVGLPESSWEASAMLGALHKTRNQLKPLPGSEREFHETIANLKDQPPQPAPPPMSTPVVEEEPMPDTKTCRNCGETKPADEYYPKSAQCKVCVRAKQKARAEAKKAKAPTDKAPEPAQSDPDPPLSDGWGRLADPRLSDLRRLQELLEQHITDSVGLEETAELAAAVASTFGRKHDS